MLTKSVFRITNRLQYKKSAVGAKTPDEVKSGICQPYTMDTECRPCNWNIGNTLLIVK